MLRRTVAPKAPRLELIEYQDGGPPRRVFRMVHGGPLSHPLKSRFQPRPRRRER